MESLKETQNPKTAVVQNDVLQRVRVLIGDQLAEVEKQLLQLTDLQPDELRQAVSLIVGSGGKRIRPIMVLLVTSMFATAERGRAIHLASAVEMLQTATLVHDDLIDGSLVRRGAQTLNAVWTPAATVLTGDYLFAYASNLASRVDSVRVMSIFADTLSEIVGGELRQMFTDWGLRSTRDDYYRRIYAKTASLYVLASTTAGVISSADDAQLRALLDYGRDFGLAFQIVDDVLDFTGEQATVGKPVGSDLRRGMVTLPTIIYAEMHGEDPNLACALRGECTPQQYDALISAIRESDAVERSLAEARTITDSAKRALDVFAPSQWRDLLCELADYNVRREK